MTTGILVFLAGLFGVPVLLLIGAHRLRRRSDRVRGAFWGAVIGHIVAALLAVTWGMVPPEAWTDGDTLRGFAGLWSLLTLPLIGAAAGAIRGTGRRR